MPNRWAKYLYKFLIPRAGTFGVFTDLSETLRAEFEFSKKEWEGAYQGLTSSLKGAAPRLYHQPEESLWFIREQFEEQTINKGGASPNHLIGLRKTFENLPEGIIRQAFIEKYGHLVGDGATLPPILTPTQPLPSPFGGATIDPTPKEERKKEERNIKTKTKYIPAKKTKASRDFVDKPVENPKPPSPQAGEAETGQEKANALGGKPKARSLFQKILDGELLLAQAVFFEVFRGRIGESKIGRLVFGEKGNGRNCFEAVPVLIAFWKSLKPEEAAGIDDPYAYTLVCARDPQTVERFKKQVFDQPAICRTRGGDVKSIGEILKAAT